jgi:hypothetical protein
MSDQPADAADRERSLRDEERKIAEHEPAERDGDDLLPPDPESEPEEITPAPPANVQRGTAS